MRSVEPDTCNLTLLQLEGGGLVLDYLAIAQLQRTSVLARYV